MWRLLRWYHWGPRMKQSEWEHIHGFCLSTTAYNYSTAQAEVKSMPDREVKVGMEIEGFHVDRVASIAEFHLNAIRLRHINTGAQYLHLQRADNNNVFCVGFRTTPDNSSGLPHILEHTTLCGSKKYPCRDTFFKMLNRSMATFMNATTGADYTLYPFSTQNKTDFSNLMSVYLDAVFKPHLKENDFRQEGWRLEHENVNDPKSPIVFKGVVFNEMKGAFSENQTILGETLLNNIMPSNTYSFISGGDPLVIPQLTHKELIAFHKKFYHPSNSRFYSYGNFPLKDHLEFINQSYLQEFGIVTEHISKSTVVPSEERWARERSVNVNCRFDPLFADPAKQSSLAISHLCSDITDIQETFLLQVLSELLARGPNSEFYKTMIDTNISAGFSPLTGYFPQTKDTIFSLGLQGLHPNDVDRVLEVYNNTIDKVITDGFDDKNIEAVLHNIELSIKHQTSDFGIGMLFGLTPLWNHDGDVIQAIRVTDQVNKLKSDLSDNPRYLQDRVEFYFKNNTHCLIVSMSPDKAYEQKMTDMEKQLLEGKLATLNQNELDKIYSQGIQLQAEQEAKQSVDFLPTLRISDMNQDIQREDMKTDKSIVPVYFSLQPTNGLVYFRGVLNTSLLSEEAKRTLPLFCEIISKMGTERHDYREMDQLVHLKTGGLSFSIHIAEALDNCNGYEEGLLFSSCCLDRNTGSMMELWSELFNEAALSSLKRFETLVMVSAADLINGIADSGHQYAMSVASGIVNPAAQIKEIMGGLTYIKKMKEISQEPNIGEILDMLGQVASYLLQKKNLRLSVNMGPESENKTLLIVNKFLNNLPGHYENDYICTKQTGANKVLGLHHILPFPVSHTGMALPSIHYKHNDFPTLRVLCQLLSSKYLLPQVREKGGAYSAGINVSTAGVIQFYSYRDPNPAKTFEIFDAATDWIAKNEFTDQDIEEAKLGMFQSIDAPVPPGARGMRYFLYRITDDELQSHRTRIMSLGREHLTLAAQTYLKSASCIGRALIGPRNVGITSRKDQNWREVQSEYA